MANEEVDYYYSPSKFSIRDSATTVDTHIEILNKGTSYIVIIPVIDYMYPLQLHLMHVKYLNVI